jgi:hypothetical protein
VKSVRTSTERSLIYQGNDKIFESGKQESRKGISVIEGKGAMGSAERALVASEFQTRKGEGVSCIETRSAPAFARCYPRSFTFYLGNPFLRSCFPYLTLSALRVLRLLLGEITRLFRRGRRKMHASRVRSPDPSNPCHPWLSALPPIGVYSCRFVVSFPKAAPSRRTPKRFARNRCNPCHPWLSASSLIGVSIRGWLRKS